MHALEASSKEHHDRNMGVVIDIIFHPMDLDMVRDMWVEDGGGTLGLQSTTFTATHFHRGNIDKTRTFLATNVLSGSCVEMMDRVKAK